MSGTRRKTNMHGATSRAGESAEARPNWAEYLPPRRRLAAVVWLLTLGAWLTTASAAAFDGPLVVGANGRTLAFADGTPFYYVADTPWQLLASLPIEEAQEYIDIRRRQGFTALQLVATPWSFDDRAARWDFEGEKGQARTNAYGEAPFFAADGAPPERTSDVSFKHPNQRYWQHVDAVLGLLAERNMAAYFIPLWASNFAASFAAEAHYAIGRTLGERYRTQSNLIWALGGDEAQVSVAKYRALYRGLRDAGITQLVTMHPRSGRSSSDHLDDELDFHSVQDRGSVADMLRRIDADYARQPAKPTFLCETWYEHDKDGGVFRIHKTGTTAAFRAHYWAARLHGGFGEGYGGWTNWLNLAHWRRDIERPGAVAIATHMRNILNALDWHNLAPDEDHAVLAPQPRIHVARSAASKTLVAYFEAPTETTLHPSWFGGRAELVWYDPANGAVLHRQTVAGSTPVRSPGGADAVLVVEAEAAAFD